MRKLLITLTLLPTLVLADRLIPTQDFMVEIHTNTAGDPSTVTISKPSTGPIAYTVHSVESFRRTSIFELYDGDLARMMKITRDTVYFYKAGFEMKSARTVQSATSSYSKKRK